MQECAAGWLTLGEPDWKHLGEHAWIIMGRKLTHRPLTAKPIKVRRFPILADQAVAIGVGRRGRAALLLQQHRTAIVEEAGRRAACRATDATAEGIIGEADDVAALRDTGQFAIIVECLRVGRAAERSTGLLAVGVVAVAVDKAAGRAVELVIAVEDELVVAVTTVRAMVGGLLVNFCTTFYCLKGCKD